MKRPVQTSNMAPNTNPKSHRLLPTVLLAPSNSNKIPRQIYKIKPKKMEGEEIFASIESLWFYSGVFLRPSSKQKSNSTSGAELLPRKQDLTASQLMDTGGGGSTDPKCIEDEEVAARAKRSAAAGSRDLDERMEIWQEQTRVVAVPARCSPSPLMPAPGDGLAMKAHLRSWAHAVACSVR